MLLLTREGGGWEKRPTDHQYGRHGPAAEEPKRSAHGAGDTWEKVVSQKAREESFAQEDVTGSVQHFREGQSDQDGKAHSGFSNKDDIDYKGESWVSGLVGIEPRLKFSSDRVSWMKQKLTELLFAEGFVPVLKFKLFSSTFI